MNMQDNTSKHYTIHSNIPVKSHHKRPTLERRLSFEVQLVLLTCKLLKDLVIHFTHFHLA